MKHIDVLCVGATSYDFVFWVNHQPRSDEKTTADAFTRCGGGPAANASVTVARMGLRSAFAGYLGSDIFGQMHIEELKAAGVDTGLVVRGEYPTPLSSVLVNPSGERSLVNYRDPDSVLPAESMDFSIVHPKVILFDGHEPELSLSLINDVHARGIKTVLDAGSLNKGTAQLFDKVGYLVCSEKFAYELTGASSPERAMESFVSYSRGVVITLGKNGLIWKNTGSKGRIPAFPVDVKDSTGAGDVFHGAFAGCLAMGKEWIETLTYSSAAAALCCTKLGARTGIPEGVEIEQFLKKDGPEGNRTKSRKGC
ncbi:MAG: carbohydrate kinase [Syntrophus sp. (in: bacteria)]|nr:carbohydrate kinase [Syntrophus sp. (in: bacteria)]